MKTYAYDIECFKNLFTATFVNIDDESEVHVFYVGLGKDTWSDIVEFLSEEMTLVGYNSISYDDPMLRYLLLYRGSNLNKDIFEIGGKLIGDMFRDDSEIRELRYPRNSTFNWRSIDLMKILAFDQLGISLKQVAITLRWYRIQDLPIAPHEHVKPEQLAMILDYNLNDTLITNKLYDEAYPLVELRAKLSKIYNLDFSSASDSKIANLILESIYQHELKMDIRTVRHMRTEREKVLLGDCIAKFVEFKTPALNEMLERVSSTYVYQYNTYRYLETLYFANCRFVLGIGGLHSVDEPGIFESTETHIIQDLDVSSYYPNLIINNMFYPKHLGPDFIKVLKRITTERIQAKKSGDKVKADGLKITVNSIFGKLGSEQFWLLDAKQLLSTTVSGQLGLLMLIEDLHLNGIEILSCNTDGIVCRIPRELESKYYEVTKRWEEATNLELEFTPYKKYIRRDVNTYITEKADGSTKERGAFLKEPDLKKSYKMPIVAKALYAYYIKGIPVRQTLEECKDIMDFCISQKSGNSFSIELHTTKGIEKLQKTNRFYIAKRGGAFIKRQDFTQKTSGLYVGNMVRILNTYDPSVPFEDYEVELAFYEKEAMKIIDEIEPRQLRLFDFSDLSHATITKAPMPASYVQSAQEDKLTVNDLNKLGKNQLAIKMSSIVKNNQKIERISPRYVYIMDINYKSLLAKVYCLAKGVVDNVYINRSAYKKTKVDIGDLVFCSKFEKINGAHSIAEYKITEKIEEDRKSFL